jgi:hypothetical protein
VRPFRPNQDTGWHTRPGPVFVEVVKGSLTYEDAHHGKCRRLTCEAGEGFFDRGFGHVHHAVAGAEGAEFYPVYVLPPGSETHVIPSPQRRRSARPKATMTTRTTTTTTTTATTPTRDGKSTDH